MRIGFNAIGMLSHASGLGVYTRSVLQHLLREGIDVKLFLSNSSSYRDAKVEQVPIPQGTNLFTKALNAIGTQAILPQYMRRYGISVCVSPSPFHGLIAPPAPQITVVLDLISLHFPGLRGWSKYYYRCMLPSIIDASAKLIAISEFTRQDIIQTYGTAPNKIETVYLGYDHDFFHPLPSTKEIPRRYGLDNYFLYVGDQGPRKNLHRLIAAFAESNAQTEGFTLAVAGRHDNRNSPPLPQYAETLGISDKVAFLGYVPLLDLPALYRGARALTFVSLYEGFGLPSLEAMACGTPVIGARTSCFPEIVKNGGLLVDPKNVSAISAAMDRLAEDDELHSKLVKNALNQAQGFSWRKCAKGFLKICHSVA